MSCNFRETAGARLRGAGSALAGLVTAALVSVLLVACAAPERRTEPEPQAVPVTRETTIALLGATGMVGGYILEQALAQGYQVRALARTPSKLDAFRERIAIVQGDARDPVVIRQLLTGSDLVISALGPVRGDGQAAKTVSTVVTGHVIAAMAELAIERYIVISGGAVNLPGDQRNLKGRTIRMLAELAYGDTVKDKQAEYALLAASDLHWTLVRCPLIEAEAFGGAPLISLASPPAFSVRAGEVAHFVLAEVNRRDYVRKGPFLGSR